MDDTRLQDKSFLQDQSQWPNMDDGSKFCCLKRNDDNAFILEWDNPNMNDRIIISFGYVFDGGTGETKIYPSLDDLLNDGWIVD